MRILDILGVRVIKLEREVKELREDKEENDRRLKALEYTQNQTDAKLRRIIK